MRILKVHNFYQQPGGEDISYQSEVDMFMARGHEVHCEEFRNSSIEDNRSLLESARLAASTIWSRDAQRRLQKVIKDFQPDVAHFHNTFPLVSPAAYYTCRKAGVPVVQTLANHRLLCPSATFYREGQVCEDCLGRRVAWPGILHACYHDSRAMTATVAAMQTAHQLIGTWNNAVDVYIALSENSRDIFVRGGFAPDSIVVKPNFLAPDPGIGDHAGDFVLFVGRLSPEKGITTLLQAWELVPDGITLKIVGDGPLAPEVAAAATSNPFIEWLGRRPSDETVGLMGDAALLIFASEWNETFGRTMIEAYARGTPVLASNLGAAATMVKPECTGLHFEAGNARDLASKVAWLFDHQCELTAMGKQARTVYEQEYTAEQNYHKLLEIYQIARVRNEKSQN
jgi:glycosyltransferase involved in cell wall biosynthesis